MGTTIPASTPTRTAFLCLQLWVHDMGTSQRAPPAPAKCGARGGTSTGLGFLGSEEGEEVTVTGHVVGLTTSVKTWLCYE
jgi:hypothetical protein